MDWNWTTIQEFDIVNWKFPWAVQMWKGLKYLIIWWNHSEWIIRFCPFPILLSFLFTISVLFSYKQEGAADTEIMLNLYTEKTLFFEVTRTDTTIASVNITKVLIKGCVEFYPTTTSKTIFYLLAPIINGFLYKSLQFTCFKSFLVCEYI